ncbi:VOC family protein [Psychrobacter sp. NZS113]|uniref:VOC family protein n=1 Tax=Psychrobacter sp. NZS113 TaxID=2792045 RepID=UPI0018CD5745|nr:VOC family protein [Psychrobacter sp. NZS113]MBH0095763.1 VOC family protein [Psychrobacter sp. NZS113]
MINGIKTLKFGVEDRKKCQNFAIDFGLEEVSSDIEGTTKFSMDNGSAIYVYDKDDTRLPPAFEDGSTLREVTWAVDDQESLNTLKDRLQGVDGYKAETDMLYCRDPNGLTLSFEISVMQTSLDKASAGINQYGSINRINEASPVYEKAAPLGVGHVVLFSPNLVAAQTFYEDKLGFYLSDAYNNRGAFLRCSAEGWHHNLFLLKLPHRDASGLNHVAFIVRDIHEVIGGGLHMNRKKWDSFIGPGRHPVSSAYFWYVHSPFGGAFEYYTNDDYLTPEWQARHYDYSLDLFTEWAVEGGIDDTTRRQINNM